MTTVYIGVIPGVRNLAGKLFRTDEGQMYCKEIQGAKYLCDINGGKNRYYFIEERYWIEYPGTDKKPHIGNIKKIHHFNQDNGKQQTTGTGQDNSDAWIELFGWCAAGAIAIAALTYRHNSRAKSKTKRSKPGSSAKTDSGNTAQDDSPKQIEQGHRLQLPGRKDGCEGGME